MKRIKDIIFITILIAFDFLTKYFAVIFLKDKERFTIIPRILCLQYHENTGAAFGIMGGKQIFLLIITLLILSVIVLVFLKIPEENKYLPLKLSFSVMLAGAIGNLIDRIFRGYVVDFIYFEIINFPIFNVADIYITVSSFLLIVLYIFYYKEEDFDFINNIFKVKTK